MPTMYSKVVFPQAASGFVFGAASGNVVSYSGIAPSTATSVGAVISPTWNPASANAADRTQWWVDTAGSLTYSEVQIEAIGLPAIANNQANAQIPAFQAATETSIAMSIGGTSYTFSLTKNVQALNLLHGNIANASKFAAKQWAASTVVAANTVILEGGEYYITPNGGTTGATAPVFPANSLTSTPTVNDNGVTWNVLQFNAVLTSGVSLLLSVSDLDALFAATFAMVNSNYITLNAVNAKLTTVANATLAWTAGATVAGGAAMVLNGTLYTADAAGGVTGTTEPTFGTAIASTTADNTVTWTCMGDVVTYIQSQTF